MKTCTTCGFASKQEIRFCFRWQKDLKVSFMRSLMEQDNIGKTNRYFQPTWWTGEVPKYLYRKKHLVPSHPIPSHSIPFHFIPFHCLHSILYHPIPSHSIPFYPILFHPIPSRSIPSRSNSFYPIPSHSIPFYPIPPHSVSSRSIACYSIPFHSIPFHPIPFYPVPFHPVPFHTILSHSIHPINHSIPSLSISTEFSIIYLVIWPGIKYQISNPTKWQKCELWLDIPCIKKSCKSEISASALHKKWLECCQ